MNKKIESFVKFLVCATFVVPLIILPNSFIFPFIVPKIIVFRSLVLLMLGAYILLLATNWDKYKIRWNYLNIAVALFFVSFSISTFVGVDWYKSFWDNHERMLGLFTIFHYIVYYYIVSSIITEWRDWKWLLRVFLLAGSIVMLIGFLQKFVNPDAFLNRGSNRVSATLGNAIYFSGYGLFLFALGVLLVIKETRYGFWWFVGVFGGLLGFGGVFWGGTRGTLLGLIAGVGILLISYALGLRENQKLKNILRIIIVVGVVLLSTMFIFRSTPAIKNIPVMGKLLNSSFTHSTGQTRAMSWGIAIEAWQEKPIFGWGPNNYYYAYNKYYRPEFLEHGWGETWFDNAHSVILNTLAVQGGIGLIIYLFLFIAPIFLLWRAYKEDRVSIHLASVGSAFLIAHLVAKTFVFEDPTSYLYFFFFLAFIASQTAKKEGDAQTTKSTAVSAWMVAVIVAVVSLFIYSTNINPARANRGALNTIRALGEGKDFVEVYKNATKIPTPHIDDIRNDFARSVTGPISNFVQSGQGDTSQAIEIFDLAYAELSKNRILHPLDIRVNISQAQLAQLGANLKKDSSLFLEAEKVLEDALQKSPKRQQVQYMLASAKYQIQKPQEAIDIMRESVENDPKISEGWRRLAILHKAVGQIDQARAVIEEGKSRGAVFSESDLDFIEKLLADQLDPVDEE